MHCSSTPTMTLGSWVLLLLTLLLSCTSMGDGAGAPSPAASTDCSSVIPNLADCLPFVQEGSKVAKPDKSCCSGLKQVVKVDVACLCDAFKQSAGFGISLNMTKALSLPADCGVSTPPLTQCKTAIPGVPSAAPAPAMGIPSSSPSGVSAVPASSPSHPSSGAMSTMAAVPSVALLVNVALAVSVYYL